MFKLPKLMLSIIAAVPCCAFAAAEPISNSADTEQAFIAAFKTNSLEPDGSTIIAGHSMPYICAAAFTSHLELLKYLHETAHISLNTSIEKKIMQLEGERLEGYELIHLAIVRNNFQIVDYLIKHGVSPNTMVKKGPDAGQSPIHMACRKETCAALETLSAYPTANFNAPVGDDNLNGLAGLSPIHLASLAGKLSAIKWLRKNKGIRLDQPVEKSLIYINFTPFHLAAMFGHLDIIKYLYAEEKLDPRQPVKANPLQEGFTVFHLACRNGKINVVEYLYSTAKIPLDIAIKRGPYSGLKPIHLAASWGHLDLLRYLHQHLPNCINTPVARLETDYEGLRPIQFAALNGHLPIIQYLHEQAKVPLNEVVPSGKFAGYSLIHIAASFGHAEIVRYLLDKQINPDEDIKENAPHNSIGSTSLFIAIKAGYNDIVKELIAAGANTAFKLPDFNNSVVLANLAIYHKNAEALGYLRGKTACYKCFQDGSLQCSQCKKVYYCSSTCQKADWADHKDICKITRRLLECAEKNRPIRQEAHALAIKAPETSVETLSETTAITKQTETPVNTIIEAVEMVKAGTNDAAKAESTCHDQSQQNPTVQSIETIAAASDENNLGQNGENKSGRSPSPAKKSGKRNQTPSPQSLCCQQTEKEQSVSATESSLFSDTDKSPSPTERRPRSSHTQQHTIEQPPRRYRAQPSTSGVQRELQSKQQEANTFKSLWLTQHAEIERLRAELSTCRAQLESNQNAQGKLMALQDSFAKQEKIIAKQQARDYEKTSLKDLYNALLARIRSLMPDYVPANISAITLHNQQGVEINDTANRLKIYLFEPTIKNSLAINVTLNKKLSKWFGDFANAFIQQGGFDATAGKHFAEDDDTIKRTIQIHRFAREADQYATTHGIMTMCTNNGLPTTRIDVPCLIHYLDSNKLESSTLVYLIQGTECFHRNIEPLKVEVLCDKANINQRVLSEYILNPELFRKTFLATR